MTETAPLALAVADSLARSPVVGVVRTASFETARQQAIELIEAGLALVEITFTVPDAPHLVEELIAGRGAQGPPWIGMGTVTTEQRVSRAHGANAEFLVSPNVSPSLAAAVAGTGLFWIAGALTPSEIVSAWELGAHLIKVYPLPPIGGADYLQTVRQPLGDVPMLAAGGFPVDEIPAYRRAGASAFGMGAPLLGAGTGSVREQVARALAFARGQETR
ncbi:MAG TPA: 2-dehydro-3-deoxyphosphogluconate aldolase [Thermoanaerobaculia bacterium]|nr:2-dehydro-3-deoxyphosphogluconate aldolase [Thermoanaerobaculia bacterium]